MNHLPKSAIRLPLALATLTAASPALAHETGFLHTHAEGLMAVAAIGVAAALVFRFVGLRRTRK